MKVRFHTQSKLSKKKLILIICLAAVFLIAAGVGLYFLLRDNGPGEDRFLLDMRQVVFDALPAEVEGDVTFPTSFEGYEGVTIAYQSSNEAALTSDGKVRRTLEDVNVTLTVTLSHPEHETVSFQKNVQVKKMESSEALEFAYSQVVIDRENADGTVLPVSIPEYGITITYEPYAMLNGEYERSVAVEVLPDRAVIHVSPCGERKVVMIVAKFEFYGNVSTRNYPVYTLA